MKTVKEKKSFLDQPRNIVLIKRLFHLSIVVTSLLGFFISRDDAHFWWEEIPVFFSGYGLVGCVIIVAVAKTLGYRYLLKKEDYYD
jgi:hypothetical protein